jgi:signal transduction histidine kinase/ligand-binding sensor domain-containing protein/CheY-like chemotaxis protein/AraC-like DNA-binding protein
MKTHLLFLVAFCALAQLPAQEINFEHIAANNGLSQISVMSIYQDEHGYMWFGTREGLNRFDGQDIEIYLSDESDRYGIPSNLINTIVGDQDGYLYILCGYKHLVSFDKRQKKFQVIHDDCRTIAQGNKNLWYAVGSQIIQYNFSEKKSLDYYIVDKNLVIRKLYETSSGKLYIGTDNGLAVLDGNKMFNMVLADYTITSIFEDSRKNIWVGTTDAGVFMITRTGQVQRFRHQSDQPYYLSSDIIRDFCEDNFGQIWVATFKGLDKVIPESGQIVNYKNYGDKPTDLSHTSIYALFKDKQGTIWIGTYYGGVNYFNPEANIYTYFYPSFNNPGTINFPIVGKMAEDMDGNLWICTEGGGLNFYNRQTHEFKHYKAAGNNSLSHNNLKCIWYNPKNHNLYIGTHMGGLNIFDIRANRFRKLTTQNNPLMPDNVIEAIQPYGNNLLVLTQKGMVWLDLATESVSPFFTDQKLKSEVGYLITTFTIDSNDNLWLAETDGGVKRYNLRTRELKNYAHNFEKPGSIGRHAITRIIEDRRGRLMFASLGSGLFQYLPDRDIFVRYSVAINGIMSDFIYDIAETSYGYLLLLTNNGVNVFDPETNKSQFLDRSRGLPLEMINVGCGIYTTKNAEIFVGGINGMTSFFENQLTPVPKEYQLFFSDFFLNNELVKPKDKTGILEEALPYLTKIKLNYKQNNFSVKFAVSNYIKANKTLYQYRLSGLDDKWMIARDQTISYSNLRPGSYVLQVREVGTNNKDESVREIQLPINISPPFYASLPAYLVYLLLIGLGLWRYIVFNKTRVVLKTSLEYEIREKERIKELNQTKLQFFTNISHEFRTPLTLIIGQIESMGQMENISPAIHNKLVKVYRNATQLRNLITELLDFRKQERDLLAIKVSNQDIVGFIRNIFQSFNDMAAERKIDFSFFSVEKNIPLWFDAVQLQKVFYNLISNAFKYSDDNSSIALRIERKLDRVIISVSDSGVGIAEDELDRIFERFYQPKNQPGTSPRVFSTGVGLSLSKGIVELHHGEIKATKNKNAGTTFIVTLLTGSDHFSSEEKSANSEMDLNTLIETDLPDRLFLETIVAENDEDNHKSTILIVEDNTEMLQFLRDVFSAIYHVETAIDGLDAIEKVKDLQPDIVLSDVMMPNMSGKELCAKLKTNFETSHIPVVLLTADSSEEQNIEGLMLGADDYITKPFNVKALISRCNNLIINRKRMQERFFRQTDDMPVSLATNKMDQELLEKATKIVLKYIDDPDFDVNTFASEMALGRSKLYIKLKGITGMTPNNFILNIRLKSAANLLTTGNDLNISDITYRLGFSTPRYFSKCFKELFGLSPLHYRKANNPAFANKEITTEEEEESM